MLAARIFGTLMLSGVFFSASGNSSSKDAPEVCRTGDMMTKLFMSMAIAVISSIFSAGPLAVMLFLHKRDIIYIAEGDERKRKKMLALWKIEDMVLWVFGGSYTLAAIVFTMSFLANITQEDHTNFLVAAGTSIFKQAVVTPLIIATFLAIICTAAGTSPVLLDKVRISLGLREDGDQEDGAVDNNNTLSAANAEQNQDRGLEHVSSSSNVPAVLKPQATASSLAGPSQQGSSPSIMAPTDPASSASGSIFRAPTHQASSTLALSSKAVSDSAGFSVSHQASSASVSAHAQKAFSSAAMSTLSAPSHQASSASFAPPTQQVLVSTTERVELHIKKETYVIPLGQTPMAPTRQVSSAATSTLRDSLTPPRAQASSASMLRAQPQQASFSNLLASDRMASSAHTSRSLSPSPAADRSLSPSPAADNEQDPTRSTSILNIGSDKAKLRVNLEKKQADREAWRQKQLAAAGISFADPDSIRSFSSSPRGPDPLPERARSDLLVTPNKGNTSSNGAPTIGDTILQQQMMFASDGFTEYPSTAKRNLEENLRPSSQPAVGTSQMSVQSGRPGPPAKWRSLADLSRDESTDDNPFSVEI
jgi:hypothetical protein